MPSCPPTTTTSPIELAITSSPIKTDCSQLNTNHKIDYNTLSKFLTSNTTKAVHWTAMWIISGAGCVWLSDFNNEKTVDCRLYQKHGLASEFKVSCLTWQKLISNFESARSNSNGDRNDEIRNNAIEAKYFSINKQFILGCHEAGIGPADVDIICSTMNLPLVTFSGFWSTQSKLWCSGGTGCRKRWSYCNRFGNQRGMSGGNISDTQCHAWTRRLGWQRNWLYPNQHFCLTHPKEYGSFSAQLFWNPMARSPLSVPEKKIVSDWKFTVALGLKEKEPLSSRI